MILEKLQVKVDKAVNPCKANSILVFIRRDSSTIFSAVYAFGNRLIALNPIAEGWFFSYFWRSIWRYALLLLFGVTCARVYD